MPVEFAEAVKEMKKAGLPVQVYTKPPDGAGVFSASIYRDRVYLYPGAGQFEVAVDKKERQAVLTVVEPTRKVAHTVTVRPRLSSTVTSVASMSQADRANVEASARAVFPVRMSNARYTFEILSVERVNDFGARHVAEVKVTATARKATTHFLIGRDEKSHFISVLPEAARSVAEAHRILRPQGLRSTAVRQGEWFFEPVSATRAKELDHAYFDALESTGIFYQPLERSSSHEALVFEHEGQRYTRGWVRDTRKGHHAPLWLEQWHRIVRNRERVIEPRADQRMVRYD